MAIKNIAVFNKKCKDSLLYARMLIDTTKSPYFTCNPIYPVLDIKENAIVLENGQRPLVFEADPQLVEDVGNLINYYHPRERDLTDAERKLVVETYAYSCAETLEYLKSSKFPYLTGKKVNGILYETAYRKIYDYNLKGDLRYQFLLTEISQTPL